MSEAILVIFGLIAVGGLYSLAVTFPVQVGIVFFLAVLGYAMYLKIKQNEKEAKKAEEDKAYEKINLPEVNKLVQGFVKQYINEEHFSRPKIFLPNDVKVLNSILKDEVGYQFQEEYLSEYLQEASTLLTYNAFDKRFCELNPNLGVNLSEWIKAYVDIFEENADYVDLFRTKLEKLGIDPTKGITKDEIGASYCELMQKATIDEIDNCMIDDIFLKRIDDVADFFIYAHIQKSLLMQYRKNGRLRKKCNIELSNYNEPEDLMPHLQIIVCYKESEEKILLEIANLLLSQHKKKSSSNLELKKCISLYRISNIKFYINHVISKAIAVRYCGDLSKICNIKQQSN